MPSYTTNVTLASPPVGNVLTSAGAAISNLSVDAVTGAAISAAVAAANMSTFVSGAAAQSFTAAQKQQAATNIGTALIVEPEQFTGATDDLQLAAAINSLLTTGGRIRLRPGKIYHWANAIGPFDFSLSQQPIVIEAYGAQIVYNGSAAAAFTLQQTSAPANIQNLNVEGGTWWGGATADSFFLLKDTGCAKFNKDVMVNVPNGAAFHVSNVAFWSERNEFEGHAYHCQEAIRFTVDGSSFASMARTKVNLRVTGGTSGKPQINIPDGTTVASVYDSVIEVSGNINDGVIVMRLNGNMGGTRIAWPKVEAAAGATTAAYFQVGTMAANTPLPSLIDGPPITTQRTMLVFDTTITATLPWQTPWFPNGQITYGGITSTKQVANIASGGGAASFNTARSNYALVNMAGNCTGTTLTGAPAAPAFAPTVPGTYTQTFTLAYQQPSGGGKTYVWPTNCTFAGNVAPSDTTSLTVTSVTFIYDNGKWREIARSVAVPA